MNWTLLIMVAVWNTADHYIFENLYFTRINNPVAKQAKK